MAKKPKGTRREKREQRKQERQAEQAAAVQASTQRKKLLTGIVAVTLVACAAIYATELPRALLGIVLLVGIGAFLAVGLGGLGSSVKPRDRAKSSNIDYGN